MPDTPDQFVGPAQSQAAPIQTETPPDAASVLQGAAQPPLSTLSPPPQAGLPAPAPVARPDVQANNGQYSSPPSEVQEHHSAIGRLVSTLAGDASKPGGLARSILAGALAGLANSGSASSPGEAAGRGFTTASEFMDKRRQQAFENQRQMGADQRAQNADTRAQNEDARAAKDLEMRTDTHAMQKELHKTNAELLNMQVRHQNQLIQGTSLQQHRETGDAGKARFDAIVKSGGEVIAQDVSESEMHKYELAHPSTGTGNRWMATGWTPVLTKDGKSTDYEQTYSLAKLPDEITMTPELFNHYKAIGMGNIHPAWERALPIGKKLSRDQLDGWDAEALKAENLKISRAKAGMDKELHDAQIKHLTAQTSQAYAAAKKETKSQAVQNSLDEWETFKAKGMSPEEAYNKLPIKDRANVFAFHKDLINEADRNATATTGILERTGKDLRTVYNAGPGDLSYQKDPQFVQAMQAAKDAKERHDSFNFLYGGVASKAPGGTQPAAAAPAPAPESTNKVTSFIGRLSNSEGRMMAASPQDMYHSIVDSSELSPSEKTDALLRSKAEMPWSEVEAKARSQKMKPEEMARLLRNSGLVVEAAPRKMPDDTALLMK